MKKLALILSLLIASSAIGAANVDAQTRPDSAAILLDAAERFAANGQPEVADALMEMILIRFGDTTAADLVRQRFVVRPRGSGPASGNVELQVWSTLYGAWLGVAIPWMMDAGGPEAYGMGLLAGAPAGFLAARAFTRSRPLSEGQARAITWGGTWGTWQGFGWASVLDLGVDTRTVCHPDFACYESETRSTGTTIGAMVGGGLAGIAIGGLLSRREIPAGLATTVNFGSLWGTWFGFAGGYVAGLEDDDLFAATLIAGNVGLAATALAGPGWNLSRNRARLISIGGVTGGLAGLGVAMVLQPDDGQVVVAFPLAASIGGLVLGAALTRDYDAVRDRTAESGSDTGSFLRRENGAWAIQAPVPIPTLVRDRGSVGGQLRPAVRLSILDARF